VYFFFLTWGLLKIIVLATFSFIASTFAFEKFYKYDDGMIFG
jgi:hypothetical protein